MPSAEQLSELLRQCDSSERDAQQTGYAPALGVRCDWLRELIAAYQARPVLRDQYAQAALTGLLSSSTPGPLDGRRSGIVAAALELADEAMAQRSG